MSITRETVRIVDPCGRLRAELAYPSDGDPRFGALVIGPHPYMGGTMHNALVAALSEQVALADGVSLRFDFGGTGESDGPPIDIAASLAHFWETGHAPEDGARYENAASAFDYLLTLGCRPIALVGYSFGAAAAWRLWRARGDCVSALALISPTLARHEFEQPGAACPVRVLVLHSTDDFCTPHAQVAGWVATLPLAVTYQCREGGNHFFRGAERLVARDVAQFVARAVHPSADRRGHVAC